MFPESGGTDKKDTEIGVAHPIHLMLKAFN
jgi:hypothetical protein